MSFSIGCECEQGFVLPGFNLQEQWALIDYDISACIRCNVNFFTLLVAGSGSSPTSLTNSTNGVTIVPTSDGRYRLLMPIPHDVLSSTSATIIACNSESVRFTELGELLRCVMFIGIHNNLICLCSTWSSNT